MSPTTLAKVDLAWRMVIWDTGHIVTDDDEIWIHHSGVVHFHINFFQNNRVSFSSFGQEPANVRHGLLEKWQQE